MSRVTLRGINFADGASIEELDDWLAYGRTRLNAARRGALPRGHYISVKDVQRGVVATYLDLRKAREIGRHAMLPGEHFARSGVPCRR